jgi:membrane-bound lytic murein transglycosylase F
MKVIALKIFLFLVLIILGQGCTRHSEDPLNFVREDSLLSMVRERIDQKKQIDEFRKKFLPRDFEQKVERYYPVIRKYAKRYGFDWRLIVMQILKESRFKEDARSRVGAMGLMQIMPSTALDIRREMDIEYIANNPRENIAAGIYHLYKQLKHFPESDRTNRLKLALAAYNCGVARIFDAQTIARQLKYNPHSWETVKMCLPKLTADNWRLHLEIWELGVPDYGYFYGFDQTIDYVEDITSKYKIFTQIY